jgi:hypothetical protein
LNILPTYWWASSVPFIFLLAIYLPRPIPISWPTFLDKLNLLSIVLSEVHSSDARPALDAVTRLTMDETQAKALVSATKALQESFQFEGGDVTVRFGCGDILLLYSNVLKSCLEFSLIALNER